MHKQVNEQPPPLRELDPAIKEDLEAVTLTCLAKDPDERYANVVELFEALKKAGC